LGGLPFATHVPVCPEPPTGRKLPALLAACLRVSIGFEAFASGIGFEAFASGTGFDSAGWETAVDAMYGAGVKISGGGLVSIFCVGAAAVFGKCLFRRIQLFV
jgi:hypothetical protein